MFDSIYLRTYKLGEEGAFPLWHVLNLELTSCSVNSFWKTATLSVPAFRKISLIYDKCSWPRRFYALEIWIPPWGPYVCSTVCIKVLTICRNSRMFFPCFEPSLSASRNGPILSSLIWFYTLETVCWPLRSTLLLDSGGSRMRISTCKVSLLRLVV